LPKARMMLSVSRRSSTGLCRTWHQANARQTADEAAGRPFGIYVVFLCLMFCRGPKTCIST
jgi:hypothetical protein